MSEVEELRREFVDRIRAIDAITVHDDPDADQVNALTDALRERIGDWDTADLTRPVLLPLLDAEDPGVRGTAAGFLLRRGEQARSLAILRVLADDPRLGDVSSMAETALMAWADETGHANATG
jgi:hypothetical protein